MTIKPEHLVNVLNGEKTIEIRKTIPKNIELPCDVYLVCSKVKPLLSNYFTQITKDGYTVHKQYNDFEFLGNKQISSPYVLNGKVVCKFVLNKWEKKLNYGLSRRSETVLEGTCLTMKQLNDYLGEHKAYDDNDVYYALHIDNLVIFDKPKELREFYQVDIYRNEYEEPFKRLTKAPQSWQYVWVME